MHGTTDAIHTDTDAADTITEGWCTSAAAMVTNRVGQAPSVAWVCDKCVEQTDCEAKPAEASRSRTNRKLVAVVVVSTEQCRRVYWWSEAFDEQDAFWQLWQSLFFADTGRCWRRGRGQV